MTVTPETWKHLKRGSIVKIAGRGRAQAATRPINDMDPVTIYQHDGEWWVRRTEEFEDGRFEKLAERAAELEWNKPYPHSEASEGDWKEKSGLNTFYDMQRAAHSKASKGREPLTDHAIAEGYSDWSWEKDGTPVGHMLPHEAARSAFFAGARFAEARSPTPSVQEQPVAWREALEPFAKAAELYDEVPGVCLTHGNVELWQQPTRIRATNLCVDDLRNARAAFATPPQTAGEREDCPNCIEWARGNLVNQREKVALEVQLASARKSLSQFVSHVESGNPIPKNGCAMQDALATLAALSPTGEKP